MVFDPDAAPTDRDAFLAWFDSENDEAELFDPTRSEFSTPKLRSWLEEMLRTFPAMNGQYAAADQDVDDPHRTDYGLSQQTSMHVSHGQWLNRRTIPSCHSLKSTASRCMISVTQKEKSGAQEVMAHSANRADVASTECTISGEVGRIQMVNLSSPPGDW
jgi:hypothetical protein